MNQFKFILFFLAVSSCQSRGNDSNSEDCEPTSLKYFRVAKEFMRYSNFRSLDVLNLECDVAQYLRVYGHYGYQPCASFFFDKLPVLNETLSLVAFEPILNRTKIVLLNLRGFDVETPGPIIQMRLVNRFRSISLINSKFDFYYRGRLIDAKLCDPDVFRGLTIYLFYMHFTVLGLEDSVSFENPICPLVFQTGFIRSLQFRTIANNRFEHRYLSALNLTANRSDNDSTPDTGVVVQQLGYGILYKVSIDDKLLNTHIFKIMKLHLGGKFDTIQTDVFKNMDYLRSIKFVMDHLGYLFHASSNEWMRGLFHRGAEYENKTEMFDLRIADGSTFLIWFFEWTESYTYPDEDLCLFKHFPRKKAIRVHTIFSPTYPAYYFRPIKNASCTYKFLTQNNLYVDYLRDSNYQETDYRAEIFYPAELDGCRFEERLAKCAELNFMGENYRVNYNEEMDMVYSLKLLEFVGPVVTFPILSGLAFVLNLVVVLVINDKRNSHEKLFDGKIFKYMQMNSVFACLECLVYQARLMSICLGADSIFCSSITFDETTETIAVIMAYLSETFKTCGIISGLLFSLQRYVETSKTTRRLLTKYARLPTRNVAFVVVVVGSLLSIEKIYEHSLVEIGINSIEKPDAFQISVLLISIDQYILPVFYFFHYVFNDAFLLLLNLIVDVMLVLVIKTNLKQKLVNKIETVTDHVHAPTAAQDKKILDELKRKQASENKANAMIIFSIVIYTFCRIPELLGVFYFFYKVPTTFVSLMCYENMLCYLLADVIEYLYMLSYIFIIFTNYKFNSNFKRGLRNFLRLKTQHTARH